ncbi:FkbM family methyltransferase [Nostoc sp. ChiQUE01b]|uniref:FkbM family methyltransferase n=1 Tax=Nostoc sp. ChiQUE01b TaxID=3075376 RepID=UPI002AD232BB|nr:FkbM family methyltransferase [Nostoc sp. ChiQUE01b]MDZ8260896.1 FkbM family methyltransferase [Nostoc sp. ChiQUE01b]
MILHWLKNLLQNYIKTAIKKEVTRILSDEVTIDVIKNEINKTHLENQENIKSYIKKLEDKVDLQSLSAPSINNWYEPIIYEPSVNLALEDICQPNAIVFDVGSHDGALTLLMSRLVGPKGIVCAFEANPDILNLCTHNLIRNGCNNFFITHAAVWDKSDKVLNLYIPSENLQAASLLYQYPNPNNPPTPVKTVALDDFIRYTKLEPEVIKMDIEGAEFNALKGTCEYISKSHPHLILEQSTTDRRCIDFLKDQGYVAIYLSNYCFINSINDYPPGSIIRNVLFIHRDKIHLTPYSLDMNLKFLEYWSKDEFVAENDILILKECINLSKGRYMLYTDFESYGNQDCISLCVYVNNQARVNYIGSAQWIENSYRDCILHIDDTSDIKVEIKLWNPEDLDKQLKVKLNGVSIYKIW